MLIFFHQAPFVRFLLPLVAGIMLASYVSVPFGVLVWLFVALFPVLCMIQWRMSRWGRRREWLFGLFFDLILMTAGMVTVALHEHAPNRLTEQGLFAVVVKEPPEERKNSVRAIVQLTATLTDSTQVNKSEDLMLYLRKDSLSLRLQQGDLLLVETVLQPVRNVGNPYEFDYAAYLQRKHISRSAFAESGKWKLLRHYAQGPLQNIFNRLRTVLLDNYRQAGLEGNELAVAFALTLGYRAYMNDELLSAYSASGAMHVLSVSGLHVGVFYFIIAFLLGRLSFLRRCKAAWVLIMLGLLWMYAVITGMSPSVSRATVMFSIIVVGKGFRRKTYIYNSIAASAFLLLLLNPSGLYDVSFQLSYMAVLSIVYLYPKLYRLLNCKYRLTDKLWGLTCTSLAAQFGTAPISLYYFHQFPGYFLPTNFVAIPLSSLIIYGAVILLVLSSTPVLAELWGHLYEKLIYSLNSSVFFIEKLPGSVIYPVYFQAWECFLVYGLMICALVWITARRKKFLLVALVFCLAWAVGSILHDYRNLSRRQLIVYHSPGNTLVQLINGRQDMTWCRSQNASFQPDQFTATARMAMQLNSVTPYSPDSAFFLPSNMPEIQTFDNLIRFAGKNMLIFDRAHPPNGMIRHVDVDIALLTQNARTEITELIRCCSPETVVADASNSPKNTERWAKECQQAGLRYHCTANDGAFVMLMK
ncbi:MAG: ComEC family competence protein [Bacteroidales bacterium]|jgi:competence protein ComEC|nr:ComEC family competence protein [Bacteroidales bacterium]